MQMKILTAYFATVRFMLWEISAAAILKFCQMALKTAPTAPFPTAKMDMTT